MHTHFNELLKKVAQDNTVILAFADSHYDKVLENWLLAINKLKITNFVIICLDEKTYQALQNHNIPSYTYLHHGDLNTLWIHRFKLIRIAVMLGYHVIHSDIDAVWLKNPLATFFKSNTTFDMAFSQGTFWPEDVHKAWQFVLCCGFFYLKSNFAVLHFLKKLQLAIADLHDDQVALNRILLDMAVIWQNTPPAYQHRYQQRMFNCYEQNLFGSTGTLELALLPHHLFQRVADKQVSPFIKHIVSGKTQPEKLVSFQENDCYFLQD